MIQKLITTSHKTATSILSIQIPAYEIEAKYINSTAIPRLYDTVADIQSCDEIFYGYFFEDTLAGFISFKIDEEEVDIHRLVVSLIIFIKGLQQNYYFMYLTCSPLPKHILYKQGKKIHLLCLYIKNMALSKYKISYCLMV